MKHLTFIVILFFSMVSLPLWSEDETQAESTAENKEATEGGSDDEAEAAIASKPQRLPSSINRERFPKSEVGSMELLATHLPKDSLKWLESEHGRFLSIWQKDRTGDAKGALLIIHAEGEHPASPKTTNPLHETLPDYGWATLAISLPLPDNLPTPDRTFPTKVKTKVLVEENSEDTEVSDEQSNTAKISDEETIKPEIAPLSKKTAETNNQVSAEEITEKRLEAALTYLHDQGQFNLVILGSGYGAIRAHDFLNKITPKIDNPALKAKLEKPMRAMILVNGRNQLPTMEEEYKEWFIDPEMPVLDIFTKDDPRNQFDAQKRKVLATQNKAIAYQQVKLTTLNAERSWKENILSRRIRSFLDNNAVGIEVKNAQVGRYN